MKYTILGFSQERAVEEGLDMTDLALLGWVRDLSASPLARTRELDGIRFVWVCYSYLLEDMPVLELAKSGLRRRMRLLSDKGLLYHYHDKDGGSWSFYALTERAMRLIYSPATAVATPCHSNSNPLATPVATKYPSTINPSTINPSTKEGKDEMARARYELLKTGRIA